MQLQKLPSGVSDDTHKSLSSYGHICIIFDFIIIINRVNQLFLNRACGLSSHGKRAVHQIQNTFFSVLSGSLSHET
jgi:hypothetical protein